MGQTCILNMNYTLTNEYLTIRLHNSPSVSADHHKKTGHIFKGGTEAGGLILNGQFIAWTEWQIEATEIKPESAINYQITLPNGPHLQLEIAFELIAERLHFTDVASAQLLSCANNGSNTNASPTRSWPCHWLLSKNLNPKV